MCVCTDLTLPARDDTHLAGGPDQQTQPNRDVMNSRFQRQGDQRTELCAGGVSVAERSTVEHRSTPMTPAPVAPIDLLMTADQITDLMLLAIRNQDWIDAYLLAAGLNQLVEDRLHPDPLRLQQGIDLLRTQPARAVRGAGGLLERVAPALRPLGVGRHPRSLWRLRTVLTQATVALAHAVIDPGAVAPCLPDEFETAASQAPGLLGADVLRLPSCFRSFDQHPDDLVDLARRFLATTGTSGPVGVVGVRTSGSYLAPLCAAALEAAGV